MTQGAHQSPNQTLQRPLAEDFDVVPFPPHPDKLLVSAECDREVVNYIPRSTHVMFVVDRDHFVQKMKKILADLE